MKGVCVTKLTNLRTTTCCKSDHYHKECDSVVLGSLVKGLTEASMFSTMDYESSQRVSLAELKEKIVGIELLEHSPPCGFHSSCPGLADFRSRIEIILITEPSLLEDCHKEHLARAGKKTGSSAEVHRSSGAGKNRARKTRSEALEARPMSII